MKTTSISILVGAGLSFMPTLISAFPAINMRQVDVSALGDAVNAWAQDTATVSQFLNVALTLSPEDFITQATTAFHAEMDELNHKAVLDAALSSNPNVQEANNVLVNEGTFQQVVNLLQDMSINGVIKDGDVEMINAVRCPQVLPAIDMYFAAAAQAIGNGVASLSVRPNVCQ